MVPLHSLEWFTADIVDLELVPTEGTDVPVSIVLEDLVSLPLCSSNATSLSFA